LKLKLNSIEINYVKLKVINFLILLFDF